MRAHSFVIPIVTAVLTAVQLGVGLPVAAAAPVITTVPEVPAPPGLTTFTDNPGIVDPHSQTIDSWSRVSDPDAVAVHFTSGTPECFGVTAEVQETPDIVAVKLRGGTRPEAVDRACIMLAVVGTLTVPLSAPVGDRAVVSIT
ncbi:hypothetical protein MMUR_40050 [Mycolicibacterium murale]|jgi:hypothetical protein|uniref:Uncharacterized protein n=1 Tax=Mycolicibacterium murale TaxID=182220 RepID=A0A7I9WQP4_9MYCO|nr:hypothetical protein [Mycolicibacterium murale]MCV7183600.1 hypothetical protein [Mycolicibacterium murale]GFG59869.1 hypothetical protein MMUR_40050 [Mycolicibacterium murale]